MIHNYVTALIDTMPKPPVCTDTDVVLDGGLFNGSYLIGALYFLKEMEKRNYTHVGKLSGCSIGSLCALLYHLDALDIAPDIYDILITHLKTNHSLNIFKTLFKRLAPYITPEVCIKMNDRVFITYYNIHTGMRIVKSKYKNKRDVFNTIKRSCFVPFIIDGQLTYHNKYVDGCNPYIFPQVIGRNILYMDLFGYGKISHTISIRNENTCFHRMLSGLLDIHLFFIKNTSTSMCSCVNDWNIIEGLYYNVARRIIERVLYYIIYACYILKGYIPNELYEDVACMFVSKIIKIVSIILINKYIV